MVCCAGLIHLLSNFLPYDKWCSQMPSTWLSSMRVFLLDSTRWSPGHAYEFQFCVTTTSSGKRQHDKAIGRVKWYERLMPRLRPLTKVLAPGGMARAFSTPFPTQLFCSKLGYIRTKHDKTLEEEQQQRSRENRKSQKSFQRSLVEIWECLSAPHTLILNNFEMSKSSPAPYAYAMLLSNRTLRTKIRRPPRRRWHHSGATSC